MKVLVLYGIITLFIMSGYCKCGTHSPGSSNCATHMKKVKTDNNVLVTIAKNACTTLSNYFISQHNHGSDYLSAYQETKWLQEQDFTSLKDTNIPFDAHVLIVLEANISWGIMESGVILYQQECKTFYKLHNGFLKKITFPKTNAFQKLREFSQHSTNIYIDINGAADDGSTYVFLYVDNLRKKHAQVIFYIQNYDSLISRLCERHNGTVYDKDERTLVIGNLPRHYPDILKLLKFFSSSVFSSQ